MERQTPRDRESGDEDERPDITSFMIYYSLLLASGPALDILPRLPRGMLEVRGERGTGAHILYYLLHVSEAVLRKVWQRSLRLNFPTKLQAFVFAANKLFKYI